MIKKSFIAGVSVLLLVISMLAGMQVVELVEANPIPPTWLARYLSIAIDTPSNGSIQSRSLLVNFHADDGTIFSLSNSNITAMYYGDFFYVVDGQDTRYSGIKIEEVEEVHTNGNHFVGQVYLSNLASGNHSVTIYWGVIGEYGIITNPILAATSKFFVDPQITPQPTPYPTNTPKPSSANTIQTTGSGNELNPSLIGIIIMIAVLITASGLFLYFKKHESQSNFNF